MKKAVLYLFACILFSSCNFSGSAPNSSVKQEPALPTISKAASSNQQSESIQPNHQMFIQAKATVSSWTPEEKSIFLTACTEGTTESMGLSNSTKYCACLLEKLEKMYPVADDVINLPEKKQVELSKACEQ